MSFTLCPACRLPSERAFSALPCDDCLSALLSSPPICSTCLGLSCTPSAGECSRDWVRVDGSPETPLRFAGFHAAYLSLGPGFRVLKAWKTTRNPALERVLYAGVRRALAPFAGTPNLALVPIPQSPARRWELFGGSTLRLCEMIRAVRKESGLPTTLIEEIQIEAPSPEAEGKPSQAQMRGADRYRKPSSFVRVSRREGIPFPKSPYLLVDDFLTSGSTLRRALHALRLGGSDELSPFTDTEFHAFVLGFRPTFYAEGEKHH